MNVQINDPFFECFKLLQSPGSRAFQVFSVCVFDKAIGMLNDLAALKTVPGNDD